jgi:hypothetical protein
VTHRPHQNKCCKGKGCAGDCFSREGRRGGGQGHEDWISSGLNEDVQGFDNEGLPLKHKLKARRN